MMMILHPHLSNRCARNTTANPELEASIYWRREMQRKVDFLIQQKQQTELSRIYFGVEEPKSHRDVV